jgi:hypothetical protein
MLGLFRQEPKDPPQVLDDGVIGNIGGATPVEEDGVDAG